MRPLPHPYITGEVLFFVVYWVIFLVANQKRPKQAISSNPLHHSTPTVAQCIKTEHGTSKTGLVALPSNPTMIHKRNIFVCKHGSQLFSLSLYPGLVLHSPNGWKDSYQPNKEFFHFMQQF